MLHYKTPISMKIVLIVIGILATLFIASQLYFMKTTNDVEDYPYKVIKKYDNFEVRQYESGLFTSVQLGTKEYEQASSQGFRVLAGYIFGGNDKNQKIAMTSPVTMSLEENMTMMFMVPRDMNKEDLPKPNNDNIVFEEIPARRVAAIRFGGWASTEKIKAHQDELKNALSKEGITHTNQFQYFGYNPPYELVNRRNEIVVELTENP